MSSFTYVWDLEELKFDAAELAKPIAVPQGMGTRRIPFITTPKKPSKYLIRAGASSFQIDCHGCFSVAEDALFQALSEKLQKLYPQKEPAYYYPYYATFAMKIRFDPRWTLADTMNAANGGAAVITQLFIFITNERNNWTEADSEEEVEEEGGEKKPAEPTGLVSTGGSALLILDANISPPQTLEVSLPG